MSSKGPAPSFIRSFVRVAFSFLVLALCVRYIVVHFDWKEIRTVMQQGHPAMFIATTVACTLAYWALRTWRWRILLGTTQAARIPWLDLYLCTASGLALALVTPFQSGEAVKVELLRKLGRIERFDGYSSFAIERLLDFGSVLVLALIAVAADPVWGLNSNVLVGVCCVFAIGILAVWLLIAKIGRSAGGWLQRLQCYTARPAALAGATILSLASWLIVVAAWHGCLRGVNISLPAIQSVGLTSVMTLVNILSLIPGAVGISEAGIAMFLQRIGHEAANAQAGALMVRVFSLIVIGLGILHFLLWQAVRKERRP
jgi:uncharacterized membrane protein YbhN (UPF0104 family)